MDRRKSIFIALLLIVATALPVAAQHEADTVFTFRFVPRGDMFYVPYSDNERELSRLIDCVEHNRDGILGGRVPLYVDGYCGSSGSESENMDVARTRSNRVKSELIVRCGIAERCFVTRNHATGGDSVTVTIRVAPSNLPGGEAKDCLRTDGKKDGTAVDINNKVEPAEDGTEQNAVAATHDIGQSLTTGEGGGAILLHANLLRWATLTPSLGVEWRVSPSWGILVNGSWTSWSWNGKKRRYALWEVMPEVRYYMSKEKRGYIGAMYKAGGFNYKLSATGRQGDLMGGGVTGGYRLRLSDALSLDFSVALGYLHADYEKYKVIDGVRVRSGKDTKNWWGPVGAGVTLVWQPF